MASITEGNLPSLKTLPTELLAQVFSFLEYKHILQTATLSKALKSLVLSSNRASPLFQDFWRSLCKTSFRMDEKRFKEWPNVSCWYDMYNILNTWVKREGFYTLSQAAPWGMLCLFHLEAGKLVGEVLTPSCFTEHSKRLRESPLGGFKSDGLFDRKVFFEAEFHNGNVFGECGTFCSSHKCNIVKEDSLGGGNNPLNILSLYDGVSHRPAEITHRPARSQNIVVCHPGHSDALKGSASIPLNADEFLDSTKDIFLTVLNMAHAPGMEEPSWPSRFEEAINDLRVGTCSNENAKAMFQLWRDRRKEDEVRMGTDILESLWRVFGVEKMFQNQAVAKSLNFEYVDGPSHELAKDIRITEDMPLIKPGLYCGSYHPNLYQKYHKEILFIEYKKYRNLEREDTWTLIHEEVFNAQNVNGVIDMIREAVMTANVMEAVFVVGRKVTGDCHVPAGKCTFGALVHPRLANPFPDAREIEYAKSRDGRKILKVVRRWYGWGTVAYPGFRRPSTVPGILMQLENDIEGNNQFGFFWDRDSDESTILQWIPIQNQYPWFHK